MFKSIRKICGLAHNKSGATTVEYAMICAAIVLGVISAMRGVADENTGLWAVVSTKQKDATEAAIN